MTDDEEAKDEDMQRLKAHCGQLIEHYDSVRIFVTAHRGENSKTMRCHVGMGNWYAQYGQVTEWITLEDQRAREHMGEDDI